MKIGVAGPITLSRIASHLDDPQELPGGYQFTLIADMVVELLDRGHQVSVFTLDRTITSPKTLAGKSLTVHIGRMSNHRARDFYAAERADLVAAMRSDECELVHAHWTYEFALAAQATGRPYVVTAHDSPLDNARLFRMPYWWIRAAVARKVVGPSVSLSAVSPYIIAQYEKFFRAREVCLIPNAVPLELLSEDTVTAPKNGVTTFATILAGWDRLKNGVTALRAFALARNALPDARLVMFGRGYGLGEAAHLYAAKHSIASGIEFAGHTESRTLYARLRSEVDILVHPSRIESFGMVLIEAIASGVAVIAGERSGGVPWTLDGGRCGILVDIEKPEEVAMAMVSLGLDGVARDKLNQTARTYVSRKFAMPTIISMYEKWYESAVEGWPKRVSGLGR